jgi:hypothetical protein
MERTEQVSLTGQPMSSAACLTQTAVKQRPKKWESKLAKA